MYSSKRLCTDGCQAEYLGVAFSLKKKQKRSSTGDTYHTLRHRQCKKKHTKWTELQPEWEQPHTARSLAAFIGKILWRHSISLEPMCAIAPVISILRRLATHRISTKSTWDDKNFTLTEDEILTMAMHWDLCLLNEWHEARNDLIVERHIVRLVSDSSDRQWGYLIFNQDGEKAFERGHRWSISLQGQHIFLKELCAAVFAIRHILTVNPPGVDIHIGIDNSAAANAIRNMYSGNVMACKILDKLRQELSAKQARVFVHSLRSEDNASDAASRGKKASAEQVENCYQHLLAAEE